MTELYNLEADPPETADVAAQTPGIVARIETLMTAQRTPSPEFPIAALDAPAPSR